MLFALFRQSIAIENHETIQLFYEKEKCVIPGKETLSYVRRWSQKVYESPLI